MGRFFIRKGEYCSAVKKSDGLTCMPKKGIGYPNPNITVIDKAKILIASAYYLKSCPDALNIDCPHQDKRIVIIFESRQTASLKFQLTKVLYICSPYPQDQSIKSSYEYFKESVQIQIKNLVQLKELICCIALCPLMNLAYKT